MTMQEGDEAIRGTPRNAAVTSHSAVITRIVTSARAAYPDLEVDACAFAAYLRGLVPPGVDVDSHLSRLRPGDVYLSFACGLGVPRALRHFENEYGSEIDNAVRRFADGRFTPEDLAQIVRMRVLVRSPGGPTQPAITAYSGIGRLSAWLRVTSVRAALNATRGARVAEDALPQEEVLLEAAGRVDAELAFLRSVYRPVFREAFRSAVDELDLRQRTLLRLNLVDGLNVRRISKMYGIHHSTVARRIAAATDRVVDETRRRLSATLRVPGPRLHSIIQLMRSGVDLDLAAVLRTG